MKPVYRYAWIGVFVSALFIALGGYILWLNNATYAAWELENLQREFRSRNNAIAKARKGLNAAEIVAAQNDFDTWQDRTRNQAMKIAAKQSGTMAEAAALLLVSSTWPDSVEGRTAFEQLPKAALSSGIGEWTTAIERFRTPNHEVERWRPLAAQLVLRADREPNHPSAARLLCKAARIVIPEDYTATTPREFEEIAERIRDRYATSNGISNFCELVGGMGDAPTWGRYYEPTLREILRVNKDRYVRCTAQFALASIVQSGGIERQAEAQCLLKSFLEEFDGELKYPAQSVEQLNRRKAKRMLGAIQMHGLGAVAPSMVGLDLEGKSMSLAEYQGKVVLLSFWATSCAPCMAAIEHEKEIVEHFDPNRFAIVGVNGDQDLSTAIKAAGEHGISWRSFQNKRVGGTSFESLWHIGGWPTFYLINADSVIKRRWQGLPPTSDLKTAIGELLGE